MSSRFPKGNFSVWGIRPLVGYMFCKKIKKRNVVQFVSLLSGEIHTKDDLRKKEMNKVPNLYSILGFCEVSIVIFNKYINI